MWGWRGVGGGKVREYEGWEGEREEVGAEGDGGEKEDREIERMCYMLSHVPTHCFSKATHLNP